MTRVLGADTIDITSAAGNTLAQHRLEPKGAHVIVRAAEHVSALEKAVLASAGDTAAVCRRKKRIPPSQEALAEAQRIAAVAAGHLVPDGAAPVVDFSAYAAASRPLTHDRESAAGDI